MKTLITIASTLLAGATPFVASAALNHESATTPPGAEFALASLQQEGQRAATPDELAELQRAIKELRAEKNRLREEIAHEHARADADREVAHQHEQHQRAAEQEYRVQLEYAGLARKQSDAARELVELQRVIELDRHDALLELSQAEGVIAELLHDDVLELQMKDAALLVELEAAQQGEGGHWWAVQDLADPRHEGRSVRVSRARLQGDEQESAQHELRVELELLQRHHEDQRAALEQQIVVLESALNSGERQLWARTRTAPDGEGELRVRNLDPGQAQVRVLYRDAYGTTRIIDRTTDGPSPVLVDAPDGVPLLGNVPMIGGLFVQAPAPPSPSAPFPTPRDPAQPRAEHLFEAELEALRAQSTRLNTALQNYKPAHSKHALIEAKIREIDETVRILEDEYNRAQVEASAAETHRHGSLYVVGEGGHYSLRTPPPAPVAVPRDPAQASAPVPPTSTSSGSPHVITRWGIVDAKESDVIDLDGVVLDITPEVYVKLNIDEWVAPTASATPSRDELLREVHTLTKAMLGELRELRSAVEDLRRNVNADGRHAGGTRSSSGTR